MSNDFDDNDFLGFMTEETTEPEWRFIEGERRDVAVLFADVHGFTDMSRNLDPEVVHLKMDELLKLFTKCTHYYGGFVDKYIGDCIMSLFGAKKASEQDTERAILSGLKMIQQLKLFNALLSTQPLFKDVQLSVRIGINTGLVSVGKAGDVRTGDFTVYGNTVNLASRMESNAPDNKIMVSLHTKQAVENLFDFERVGYKEIKGFDQPIDCYVVIGVKLERKQRWSIKKTNYIGRKAEISLMQDAISDAVKHARLRSANLPKLPSICITGDAGMGKSRLLFEAISLQQKQILYIWAVASATNPAPLNLFTNLLENYFQIHVYQPLADKRSKLEQGIKTLSEKLQTPGDDLLSPLVEAIQDAAPMLGYLLEIPAPDPRLKQKGKDLLMHIQQALAVFIQSIRALANIQNQPLVISWDDLHWADETTISVLDYLYKAMVEQDTSVEHDADHADMSFLLGDEHPELCGGDCQSPHETDCQSVLPSTPILSFMLYRDWDCKPGFLSGIKFQNTIALTALKDSEIVQLIKQQAGTIELPPATIEKVRELSAGNPFYLEEWCNYIYDLPKFDAKDFPVPTNLHSLILSRLDRLSDAVRLLLQKASVIGQEFFVEILREIERRLQNPINTDTTLSELEDQSLILKMLGFDYSSYFFKHITTREVAYQTLLQINRKMLHQLTAEAIESIFPERLDEFLYALAEHYQKAELTDKAIYYLKKAAAAATANYSNALAISYYDHLLSILPDTDSLAIADTMLKKAEICWLIGSYDDSDSVLQQALIIAQNTADPDLSFEAYRQRGVHSFYREDMSRALNDFELCLKIAEEAPDTTATTTYLTITHNNLGIWYQHNKDYETAIGHYQQSLRYAEALQDTHRKAKTLSNLGFIHTLMQDYPAATTYFQSCLELALPHRYLAVQSFALGNLGVLEYALGNLESAMQYYEKKWLLVDKMDDKPEMIKLYGNIANVHRDLGQHREALEYYRKTLSYKEAMGNKKQLAITHNAIAAELWKLTRNSEALTEIDKAIDYAADYPALLAKYQATKVGFQTIPE